MVKTGASIDSQFYFSQRSDFILFESMLHTCLASASFLLIESVAFAPDGVDNFCVWVDCEKFFTNTVDVNGDG